MATIGPRLVTDGLLQAFDVGDSNLYKDKYRTETGYDYGQWVENDAGGSPGNFSDYTYDDQNLRVYGTDPWGDTQLVWKAHSGTSLHEPYVVGGGI